MNSLRHNRNLHSILLIAISFVISSLLHVLMLLWLARMDFFVSRNDIDGKTQVRSSFILEDIRRIVSASVEAMGKDSRDSESQGREGSDGRYSRDLKEAIKPADREVDGSISGIGSAVIHPSQQHKDESWQQREEIIAISGALIGRDILKGNRRIIPEISRIRGAADIVFPVDFTTLKTKPPSLDADGGAAGQAGGTDPDQLPFLEGVSGNIAVGDREQADSISSTIDNTEKSERRIDSLDNVLKASLTVYEPFFAPSDSYFMIEIERISDELLPRLPKDIVFVQDSSASMAEQRLYYCREALVKCLDLLNPDDRFEIVAFSQNAVRCFGEWVTPSESSREKGKRFISNMRSAGNTDIMGSLAELKKLDVEQGRPCIAFVVTDGIATTGIVESAQIISEFTGINSNRIAVYTMGTMSDANMYLLDLLSYCNGGATHVVAGGRWSISEDITNRVASISRPVLSSLNTAFAGSGVEVYPAKVRHLFMDDKLTLYGKCPRTMKRITFQAIGSAGGRRCDMIFDLPVDAAVRNGTKLLRRDWAFQKLYHLMGEMARSGSRAAAPEMRSLAKEYGLLIPYTED